MNEKYEKIIDLPHPTSKKHPKMSKSDRAAQFAPYSALSGYEDAVDDTATKNLDSYKNDTNYEYNSDTPIAEETP